jgi:hypothetical protein
LKPVKDFGAGPRKITSVKSIIHMEENDQTALVELDNKPDAAQQASAPTE